MVLSEKMASFLEGFEIAENDIQRAAYDQLSEMDFPTTKDEYWKYTRLGKISNGKFSQNYVQADEITLKKYLVSDQFIVIENGNIREDLSSYNSSAFQISFGQGSELNNYQTFNDLLSTSDVFNVMNTALLQKTIHISVQKNQQNSTPLQLIYVGTGENTLACNRIFIEAEQSSSSSVIVTAISSDNHKHFNNLVTIAKVGENAQLTLNKVQNTNDNSLTICTEQISQAANSTFKINTFMLNGLLIRNNINIAVTGQNCETHMNGSVVSKGKQHIDNHTFVDHQVSNCFSNENYKYVLDEQSTGVFNGRVVVQKDAQVINAYQNNGNILLSDQATVNSKPELEIYADDVKCSHGSTTGQLDENALFYLQTRGISKENARKLLVSAFIGEVIEAVEDESFIGLIQDLLQEERGWDF